MLRGRCQGHCQKGHIVIKLYKLKLRFTMNPYAMEMDEQHSGQTRGRQRVLDGDIVMKEVRTEQDAPPVYYAYRCLPLEFPMTLKGTQYEVAPNLPVLQRAEPRQLFSAKQPDDNVLRNNII
ncbi:unknown [Antheraea pernyi nucleopolyhedrovirus]|uniref:Uncharacterized protein n=1 Tax=Antheraea pernyi nuclear polyhedrosis virus TaxID=161494 RepID=Q1HGW4_NPVAP|nr:hypothetical protein APNV_p136 [Antheraea pernyi nucleopolyhedrovirus]ABF50366.1 unknown [Antheraea pernyi nucleopolyhedrovirus]